MRGWVRRPLTATAHDRVATTAAIDSLSIAEFDRTFAVNMRAAFAATHAAIKDTTAVGQNIDIGSCDAVRMPVAADLLGVINSPHDNGPLSAAWRRSLLTKGAKRASR